MGMTPDGPIGIRPELALHAANIGLWEWDSASGAVICDFRVRSLLGLNVGAVTFDTFLGSIHPEDRTRTRLALTDALHDQKQHRCECRSMPSTALVEQWIALEGRAYTAENPTRHVLGIATDISAAKIAEIRRELLSRDLEHRMTNVFSVVGAIVTLSQRIANTPEELAATVQMRLAALARAHSLCANSAPGAAVELQQVIETQLAPFADWSRATVQGPPTKLGRSQAMALNIIVHELTTNAVKHGALSPEGGHVEVQWSMQSARTSDNLLLRWKETCCSPITTPTRVGLGSKLLVASARRSLGGDICLDFQPNGLLATLAVPTARLMAAAETCKSGP